MSRSIRMFEIIQLLRNTTHPMTAERIGELLEVSKRTIYRDISALKSMRVPIDGEAGIGYIMRPGFDLPPLAFTSEEVEAIVVGLALLKRTGDIGLQNAAEQVAYKIDAVLPEGAISPVNKSGLEVSSWLGATPSGDIMSKLRQAIREEDQLEIMYSNANGDITKRRVKPLAIIYYIEVELLAVWCELRSDFRHFRVDRILKLNSMGKRFSDEMPQLRNLWLEKRNSARSD